MLATHTLTEYSPRSQNEDTFSVKTFSASQRQRDEGTSDYNVSVVKYRLVVDGKELHNIDRGNGVLIIAGVDYRSEVDKLL